MRVSFLTAIATLAVAGSISAQDLRVDEPLKVLVPKSPPTRQELERRDSLHKYVEGLRLERAEQFKDALRAYEEAARLDPNAPALVRVQIPILIGMDRLGDAQNACTKVVALDPGDFKTWFLLAKLHKSSIRYADAIAALESGLNAAAIKDHPEAAQALYFELGSLFENTEKFGPAADAFNKAAEILEHPDLIMAKGNFPRAMILARAADTYEKIGQLYNKAKRHDDAIAAFVKAQKHSPERTAPLDYVIAQICVEQGSLKRALTHVDAYLHTRPLSVDPYETKIDILRRLKQNADIVPWIETAAAREGHNNALQLLLAREYAVAKQEKKAEAIYKRLAEDSPSADAYRGLFHLYKGEGAAGMTRILGMLDKVMDKAANNDGPVPLGTVVHAKAMISALRDDAELATKLVEIAFKQKADQKELKFDTVYFLAILADRQRKTEEAERFYRQCLKSATPGNEALIYTGLLRVLGKARKHETIVEICTQGLKTAQATNSLLFYNDIARALAGLHRYDEALKHADRGDAQAGDDNKLVFKLLRIRILAMAERFDNAETECKALIKGNEKPSEVIELRYLLSNIYSSAKHSAKSEEQLQMILKMDPHNATVNNDLGYSWADQGKNLQSAEEMIRRAIELDRLQRRRNPNFSSADDKDNAAYVDSLGWVLYRRGQIAEARKELERAAALDDGEDPVIYDHLGDVYQRLQMRPEASRAWQRALALYNNGIRKKDDERVRDIQRKLEQVKQ